MDELDQIIERLATALAILDDTRREDVFTAVADLLELTPRLPVTVLDESDEQSSDVLYDINPFYERRPDAAAVPNVRHVATVVNKLRESATHAANSSNRGE